jgi:hypothetical protein
VRLEFKFALNHVVFDMSIEYEARNLHSKSHIQRSYDAIDRVRHVTIKSLSPLRFYYIEHWKNILLCENLLVTPGFSKKEKQIEFNLDATIYFNTDLVVWQPDRELPFWLDNILEVHYAAIRPVLFGTIMHYLPKLKAEAKAVVRSNAIRDAEALLHFLYEAV